MAGQKLDIDYSEVKRCNAQFRVRTKTR